MYFADLDDIMHEVTDGEGSGMAEGCRWRRALVEPEPIGIFNSGGDIDDQGNPRALDKIFQI